MNTSPRKRTTNRHQVLHRKVSLLMFLVLILGSLASIAPYLSAPVAAQPSCLDGQIWSEEEEQCVAIEDEPVLEELTPTETPQPTETPAEVVETPSEEPTVDDGTGDGGEDDQSATGSPATDLPADDLSSLQAADQEGLVGVVIGNFVCPEDFDAYSSSIDFDIIQSACSQTNPGSQYSVAVDGQVYAYEKITNAISGAIEMDFFFTVPAGNISISKTHSERFGQPVVACIVYAPFQEGDTHVTVERESRFYPVVQGTTVEFGAVEAGRGIRCNWYSIPTDASAVVFVEKFACPPGFDTTIAGPDQLKQNCPLSTTPVEFQLIHDTGDGVAFQLVRKQTTSFDPTVRFGSVKAGDFRIKESVPAGFGVPIVYCEQFGPNGQTIRQYDRYIMFSVDSIAAITNTLETLSCDWFNVPGVLPVSAGGGLQSVGLPADIGTPAVQPSDQIDQAEEAEISEETPDSVTIVPPMAEPADEVEIPDNTPGRVTIEVYECPESFDAYNATANEIFTRCPYAGYPSAGYPEGSIFEFSLVDGAGALEIQHTGLKQPYLEFDQVAPGAITLMGVAPPGFGEPVVYCQSSAADSDGPSPVERQTLAPPNSIAHALYPSEWLACGWFNVPIAILLEDAQPDQADEAEIPEDTTGSVTIAPPVAGQADEVEIPDDTPGRVTIVTYECPESFDAYNATANEINTSCPYAGYTEDSVFEFSLVDGAGALEIQHTGLKQPYLEFEAVAPGFISVTAAAPSDFGEPVVYCQAIAADSEGPFPYARQTLASPNSIEHSLYPSEWFACDWFNVPIGSPLDDTFGGVQDEVFDDPNASAPTPRDDSGEVFDESLPLETVAEEGDAGTGTDDNQTNTGTRGDDQADVGDSNLELADQQGLVGITISSYVCMEDFDAYNNSLVGVQSSCTQPRPGVEFTASTGADYSVGNVGSYPVTKVAGDDSIVRFSVPAGDISIYVFRPEYQYFGEPVVACVVYLAPGGTARDYRFYPVVQGNAIEIDAVPAGQRIRCDWWSVPNNESLSIVIEKFECPPGFDTSIAGPDQLKQNCPYSKTPVEFQLLHETGGITLGHTEVDYPKVAVYGFEAGNFTIKESIPAGFGVPIVYCEQFYKGATIRQYDRYIMISVDTIAALINTRERLECDWFNVPGSLPVAGNPALQSESIPLDIDNLRAAEAVPSNWIEVPGELPLGSIGAANRYRVNLHPPLTRSRRTPTAFIP